MSKLDINAKPFDDATLLKLDIFRKCFREWYPVFINHKSITQIYIYDMFAGSGTDSDKKYGSPLILLEEAKGNNRQYCSNDTNRKKVFFEFNEKIVEKCNQLELNVKSYLSNCRKNCNNDCVYSKSIYFTNSEFSEIMDNQNFIKILNNPKYAKFILLDQYGFSQITDEVFLKLIKSPTTDFIFFISSSFIRRFKNLEAVKKYFNTNRIDFIDTKPKECHRVVADYFRNLIPREKEYYINHFTIQKGTNYYGLIFGTSHSLGMEKFVKVCWNEDHSSGESNCNINDDFEEGSLFYTDETSKKISVKKELNDLILKGEIISNVDGLKFALSKGCEPKLFVEVIDSLYNEKKIEIIGKFNRQSTNIHKVDEYRIKVL
ncbi:MAG: three-Cys-motif partner protein TcmP [Treponemataceae bacterium]|nr:three-Cys-motif partner protein TcmP [Treponemataceae bacterium]